MCVCKRAPVRQTHTNYERFPPTVSAKLRVANSTTQFRSSPAYLVGFFLQMYCPSKCCKAYPALATNVFLFVALASLYPQPFPPLNSQLFLWRVKFLLTHWWLSPLKKVGSIVVEFVFQ